MTPYKPGMRLRVLQDTSGKYVVQGLRDRLFQGDTWEHVVVTDGPFERLFVWDTETEAIEYANRLMAGPKVVWEGP